MITAYDRLLAIKKLANHKPVDDSSSWNDLYERIRGHERTLRAISAIVTDYEDMIGKPLENPRPAELAAAAKEALKRVERMV